MEWLSDERIGRLRQAIEAPDLSGTRYRILEPLGSGGMGTVFLAVDDELVRKVAIKVLHAGDLSVSDRLLREARILAQLEHPGIMPLAEPGQPLAAEIGTRTSEIALLMRIFPQIEQHLLGEQMVPVVIGPHVEMIAPAHAALTDVRALAQDQFGPPRILPSPHFASESS